MKKLIAFLLVAIMLVPMCLVTGTAEEAVEKKPFYVAYWHSSPAKENFVGDYCYAMPFFYCDPIEGEIEKLSILIASKTRDPIAGAAYLKELFDSYPEGTRYINFSPTFKVFSTFVEDVIFMEEGVRYIKEWLDPFLAEYKRIGGKLDGISIDLEYRDGYSFYLTSAMKSNFTLMNDIVENPMYKEKLRPLLEERGFEFYPNPNSHAPEIYSANENSGSKYEKSRSIWDTSVRILLNQYITEAVFEPLMKYYPDANMGDYQGRNSYAWLKTTGTSEGGNSIAAGNTSNEYFYGGRPGSSYFTNNGIAKFPHPPTRYQALLENNVFTSFLYDANLFKGIQTAADEGRVSSWITFYGYNDTNASTVCNTPYYTEQILHQGLLDPQPFLGYIIEKDTGGPEQFTYAMNVLNDIMGELTRLVGYSDRKPIPVPSTWNSGFVLSGMYANGRNVWRITPDTTGDMTLEAFKVEGEDPTFSINGQTITFPQGTIIADGNVREVGTCGYWVETPKDVYPVITSLANRYSEYPSFSEDYEGYAPDTVLEYTNIKHVECWELTKKKGSTATVVIDKTDAENQVLALQGTFKLTNVDLPKNITAGDTYAKDQAWEIMVTLPSDMGAEAEVILLNCKSAYETDGGLKISGGKVWYAEGKEYKEIADLDVSAGGKFLVKRVMHFYGTVTVTQEDGTEKTEPAYTSSYYIYDANGELVGSAENVPMSIKTLPVAGIGVSCTNITGEPVLLDNFKLYPSGIAADFELYDAVTGIKVTDMEQARAEDTAYRLSWLNATDTEKVYSVVAAYYNADGKLVSEQVLEEVKMAPGTDGVATAIVKNETEGQTLLVYLRDDNIKANGTEPLVTVVTAVAMAFVAVLVIVAVMANVKKPKAAASQDTEKE